MLNPLAPAAGAAIAEGVAPKDALAPKPCAGVAAANPGVGLGAAGAPPKANPGVVGAAAGWEALPKPNPPVDGAGGAPKPAEGAAGGALPPKANDVPGVV